MILTDDTLQIMALSLLQGYDSDQGSSSDSEDDLQVTINKKALTGKTKRPHHHQQTNKVLQPQLKKIKSNKTPSKILLSTKDRTQNKSDIPLPASINQMFIEEEEEEVHDDPTLHEGRIRSFSHEKNNWATYVYVNLQDCELGESQSPEILRI